MYYITINVQYARYRTGRKIKYFIVLSLVGFNSHKMSMNLGSACDLYVQISSKQTPLHPSPPYTR